MTPQRRDLKDAQSKTLRQHPVRLRVTKLLESNHVCPSPSELAAMWPDVSLGVISHHLRQMERGLTLTSWRTGEQRRGAVVRRYRLAEGRGSGGPPPEPARDERVVALDLPALVAFRGEIAPVLARLDQLARESAIRAARRTQRVTYPVTLTISVNED